MPRKPKTQNPPVSAEQKPTLTFPLETVQISDLKEHPRNYRIHTDDQIAHLAQSIKEHGFYKNIVIARENTILAGHGAVKAADSLGFTSVPCIRLDLDPFEPMALKVLAGDNEIEHLAEQDDRILSDILKDIHDSDVTLFGTGYDDKMLANLIFVTRPKGEIDSFDSAAHWVGMPEYDSKADWFQVNVSCSDEATRDAFLKILDIPVKDSWIGHQKIHLIWPENANRDINAIQFTQDEN